jgi:hypothetical protein
MAIKLLTFDDQFVAGFPPDDQDDNFISFNIIQDTQTSCPQLKLGQSMGP